MKDNPNSHIYKMTMNIFDVYLLILRIQLHLHSLTLTFRFISYLLQDANDMHMQKFLFKIDCDISNSKTIDDFVFVNIYITENSVHDMIIL